MKNKFIAPTLTNYLQKSNQDLRTVLGRIQELDQLNKKLWAHLDKPLHNQYHVANWQGARLTLTTENAAVAMQIRFQTPDILKKFQQDPALKKIQEIHCKVRPVFIPARLQSKISKKMPLLSTHTAELIHDTAQSLTDPGLREVMEKIAQHTSNKKQKSR